MHASGRQRDRHQWAQRRDGCSQRYRLASFWLAIRKLWSDPSCPAAHGCAGWHVGNLTAIPGGSLFVQVSTDAITSFSREYPAIGEHDPRDGPDEVAALGRSYIDGDLIPRFEGVPTPAGVNHVGRSLSLPNPMPYLAVIRFFVELQ